MIEHRASQADASAHGAIVDLTPRQFLGYRVKSAYDNVINELLNAGSAARRKTLVIWTNQGTSILECLSSYGLLQLLVMLENTEKQPGVDS